MVNKCPAPYLCHSNEPLLNYCITYITTLREYSEVEGRLWMYIRTCSQVECSLESKLSFSPCEGCRSQT